MARCTMAYIRDSWSGLAPGAIHAAVAARPAASFQSVITSAWASRGEPATSESSAIPSTNTLIGTSVAFEVSCRGGPIGLSPPPLRTWPRRRCGFVENGDTIGATRPNSVHYGAVLGGPSAGNGATQPHALGRLSGPPRGRSAPPAPGPTDPGVARIPRSGSGAVPLPRQAGRTAMGQSIAIGGAHPAARDPLRPASDPGARRSAVPDLDRGEYRTRCRGGRRRRRGLRATGGGRRGGDAGGSGRSLPR